jgi:hypothetical protein
MFRAVAYFDGQLCEFEVKFLGWEVQKAGISMLMNATDYVDNAVTRLCTSNHFVQSDLRLV